MASPARTLKRRTFLTRETVLLAGAVLGGAVRAGDVSEGDEIFIDVSHQAGIRFLHVTAPRGRSISPRP